MAQGSPDSRLCNCFAEPVPSNFMSGVKAVYGRIGIYLSPGVELPPKQLEPVKFTIPIIRSKQGCSSWYSIYVTDDANNKVYESASGNNEISHAFPDCNQTYTVVLMAYSKSANGGDGNCTRRITFTVKPKCNTVACECTGDGKSAPYSLSGEVQCKERSGSDYKHLLKFSIVNKSDCILAIQSITIMGQLVEVPPYSVAAKSSVEGISLGFTAPAGRLPGKLATKVSAVVRYTLNGRQCRETIELPYKMCWDLLPILPIGDGN